MASHGRTLARTVFSGKYTNAITKCPKFVQSFNFGYRNFQRSSFGLRKIFPNENSYYYNKNWSAVILT
jgi:hypothetical protein